MVNFVTPYRSENTSLCEADVDLLGWIDRQPSVVYVSFGSKGVPCPEEVERMIVGVLLHPNASVLVSTR
jgi:UDP:flavonoid glycosyltransferase YjiC (YdhE family)